MKKRSVSFGSYKTAHYGWTLAGCALSAPEQKTNYLEKTGGDGSWDLSTVMTDGIPRYKNRTLVVDLELSTGNRESREKIINDFVNTLDGMELEITLPDRPGHYLVGRVHVAVNYSDLAHAAVTVTAECQPWLYSRVERVYTLTEFSTIEKTMVLTNAGRKVVSPTITVIGKYPAAVKIRCTPKNATNQISEMLMPGVWSLPGLLLFTGDTSISYAGVGLDSVEIAYREAVLR